MAGPGRKDRVIIRKTVEGEKKKTTEQVRYMLMSLREAYHKLKDQYPSLKVGLSKFCDLRHVHVKLFDQLPHQVCVCSYHENVRLLLVALKEHTTLNTDFTVFTGTMARLRSLLHMHRSRPEVKTQLQRVNRWSLCLMISTTPSIAYTSLCSVFSAMLKPLSLTLSTSTSSVMV